MLDLSLQFTALVIIPLAGLLAICWLFEIILPKDEALRMKLAVVGGIILLVFVYVGRGSGL